MPMSFDDNDYSDISSMTVAFMLLAAGVLVSTLYAIDMVTGWLGITANPSGYSVINLIVLIAIFACGMWAYKSGLLSECLVLLSVSICGMGFMVSMLALDISYLSVLNLPFAIISAVAAFMAYRDRNLVLTVLAAVAVLYSVCFILPAGVVSYAISIGGILLAFLSLLYGITNWIIIQEFDAAMYDDLEDEE
jgi:hypothetical protein